MAPTGSNIPGSRQGPIPTDPNAGERKVEGTRSQTQQQQPGAQQEAARKASTDKFSKTNINLVLKQMKETVSQNSRQSFHPSKLVSGREDVSEFEKTFLEFFMGERRLGAPLQPGEEKFRKKQVEEWKEFYEALYTCTVARNTAMEKVVRLVFRGLSQNDPRPEDRNQQVTGTVLIADLYTQRQRRARCDKFVRIPVPNETALAQLQAFSWGDEISAAQTQQCFGTGDLEYLALNYRPVRKNLVTGKSYPAHESLQRNAQAAAQARAALQANRMGLSSQATNIAQQRMQHEATTESNTQTETPPTAPTNPKPNETQSADKPQESTNELYQQKNLLDKLLS